MYLFNSMDGHQTFRSSGPSLLALTDTVEVQLPRPDRPGKVWIEALWYDSETGSLFGWYHFEPTELRCQTAPAIGAAVSYDNGLTWEDRGFVIENAHAIDCSYDNGYFSGGSGDFSVIPSRDRAFFYFFFSTYGGPPDEQGVAIARSSFSDLGQPGTLVNFHNGRWSEPSLGGRTTPLFPSSTGWKGPRVEAFWGPSVHWNTYLQRYVMFLNHADGLRFEQEGIYISFSTDMERWSRPQKLIDGGGWYPQVVGLSEGESDSLAGQNARFYQAGTSCFVIEFSIPEAGAHSETTGPPSAQAWRAEAHPASQTSAGLPAFADVLLGRALARPRAHRRSQRRTRPRARLSPQASEEHDAEQGREHGQARPQSDGHRRQVSDPGK